MRGGFRKERKAKKGDCETHFGSFEETDLGFAAVHFRKDHDALGRVEVVDAVRLASTPERDAPPREQETEGVSTKQDDAQQKRPFYEREREGGFSFEHTLEALLIPSSSLEIHDEEEERERDEPIDLMYVS